MSDLNIKNIQMHSGAKGGKSPKQTVSNTRSAYNLKLAEPNGGGPDDEFGEYKNITNNLPSSTSEKNFSSYDNIGGTTKNSKLTNQSKVIKTQSSSAIKARLD